MSLRVALELVKITAKIMQPIPIIWTKLNGSKKIKTPTNDATTGSIVAKIDALDASVWFRPIV